MSILSTSPTATRNFDMNIAEALGDINAAIILQQLHYWTQKEGVGVIVGSTKYIYNTFLDWVNNQFRWLSVWQFRKAMSLLRSLSIVKVIRHKARQWNQTNHYTLDYKKLREWAEAESIEMVEMWSNTPQGEEKQTLEMRESKFSNIEPKNTSKKETTKQNYGDRCSSESKQIAAAEEKKAIEEENSQKDSYPHSDQLKASPGQNKVKSEARQSNPVKEKRVGKVDYIVNSKWKELIPLLDSTGIPVNRTIKDLLKLYPGSKVENAIALVKARKREQHIPNPSRYEKNN